MDINNLQQIKEIFYRLMMDKNITLEEVREEARAGYNAACLLNQDIKNIYSDIGKLTFI
jgi:hypothetical protein